VEFVPRPQPSAGGVAGHGPNRKFASRLAEMHAAGGKAGLKNRAVPSSGRCRVPSLFCEPPAPKAPCSRRIPPCNGLGFCDFIAKSPVQLRRAKATYWPRFFPACNSGLAAGQASRPIGALWDCGPLPSGERARNGRISAPRRAPAFEKCADRMKEKAAVARQARDAAGPGGVTPRRGCRDLARSMCIRRAASSASRSTRSPTSPRGPLPDQLVQPRQLLGLDQTEMPLRQFDRRMPAQDAPRTAMPAPLHRATDQVPSNERGPGRNTIEDDACDPHAF